MIGSSDSSAAEPLERPVEPGELTATLLNWCGIDGAAQSIIYEQETIPLVPHAPVVELWA